MFDLKNLPPALSPARALYGQGRYVAAERACHAALQRRPRDIDALHVLGLIQAASRRPDKAVALFRQVLDIRPNHPLVLNDHGKALHLTGACDAAIESFEQAISQRPRFAEAHVNRANALVTRRPRPSADQLAEALASYDCAIRIGPVPQMVLINRANVLGELGRHEDALAAFEAANRLGASFDLHFNRAGILQRMERFAEALEQYERALALRPDRAIGHASRGALLLRLGRFEEGWREFEWHCRPAAAQPPGSVVPEWDGSDPAGKRLVFHDDQGLGDTIQFARFSREVAAMGADVTLEVRPELRRLMSSMPGVNVIRRGEQRPPHDGVAPLLSVPSRLPPGALMAAGPYLGAEPHRIAAMRSLMPEAAVRVGIAWQGNPTNSLDRGRSIPLSAFLPLAAIPGVALVSLQKNHGAEQRHAAYPVHALGEDFDAGPDAFVDTAAAMMTLDLVITSDTAIAHLAGALGRPVWVALQRVPDWRWMIDRDDSPWYPSARLFRQKRDGDWPELFERIGIELRGWMNRRGEQRSAA